MPGSRPASRPARRRWCRGACRRGRAASSRVGLPWSKTRCAPLPRAQHAPGGAARIPDRARCRPCSTAAGRRSPRPRSGCCRRGRGTGPGRFRLRSFRRPRRPATARCAAQTRGSSGDRRRRVARMAPSSARYSVCTNSFEKAGCATSAACGASTSSAVGGDFDLPHAAAGIGHEIAANLSIVFRRDHDLLIVVSVRQPRELGAVLVEGHLIVVGLDAARAENRPTKPCRCRRRAEKYRSPSRRRWRPRASA